METEKPVIEARKTRESQQEAYWVAFKDRIERLEKTYGISKSDISEGLGISRQSLYNFVNKPKKGIRIDRSSIVQLFDYIRFEQSDSLKASQGFVKSRRDLKKEDLNTWLQEAGYAPEPTEKASIAQDTFKTNDHQIKRVVFRLTSKWVPDDSTKNYLVNNFLDQVLDQSRLNESYYADQLEYLEESDKEKRKELERRSKLSKDDGYDVLSFSQKVLYDDYSTSEGDRVEKKYEVALKHLNQAGKKRFVRAELYELYQSILEHHYIDQDSSVKVSTRDCRFRSLTFDLFDRPLYKKRIRDRDKVLDVKMRSSSEIAELEIRGLSTDKIRELGENIEDDDYVYIGANPILEAVIRCQLTAKSADSKKSDAESTGKKSIFSIRYSSNATHVANLLLALKNGLCYPLDIASFFMRATGRTEKSLARVSVTLTEPPKEESPDQDKTRGEYAGWWVTFDTLTGIQKATTDAFIRWLSDRPFPQESQHLEKYLNLCAKVANIQYSLSQARRALYEHMPAIKTSQNQMLREFIETKILQEVRGIKEDQELSAVLNENDFAGHWLQLENAVNVAKILSIRTSLIENEIRTKEQTDNHENELKVIIESLEKSSDPFSRIIRLYAVSCEMTHKLIIGNQEFIVGRQWYSNPKYSLDKAIEDAKDYISSQGGVIDLDTYLSMSDLYGTTGFLGFYFSNSMGQLDQALENLLKAAHFALKTNFRRRAAQWLSYASRVCIRQGRLERASYLLSLVTGISDDAVLEEIETHLSDGKTSSAREEESTRLLAEAKSWDDISWLLAHGELLLKREGKAHEAFANFFTAFKIAISLQFFRIIPDCLYDMHKAAKRLAEQGKHGEYLVLLEISEDIASNIGDASPLLWALLPKNSGEKKSLDNLVSSYLEGMERVKKTLEKHKNPEEKLSEKNYAEFKKDFQDIYSEVSQKSLTLAVEFWNSWRANTAIPHPVAQAIQDGEFLE